jgi:hypothetical protein
MMPTDVLRIQGPGAHGIEEPVLRVPHAHGAYVNNVVRTSPRTPPVKAHFPSSEGGARDARVLASEHTSR